MIIWLIGMSGAGKTTIGRALYGQMKAINPATVFVDGDEIRKVFQHDRGAEAYTTGGRLKNAERIRDLCAWLDRQELDVVCCILSNFEESHEWNRHNYRDYFEVYISAPMNALVERSPKDLYRKAERGEETNVVGVDIPFTPPDQPDLVIENGIEMVDPDTAAQEILAGIARKFGR